MQNQFIAPDDDYKIYLRGALLNGTFDQSATGRDFLIYSNHPKSDDGEKRIPIPENENLKLINLGLQFTCLMTHSKKVYLFGDFAYDGIKISNADGNLLKIVTKRRRDDDEFILNEQFELEPIAMCCGEQFVAVLDCGNRVWFCGAARNGSMCVTNYVVLLIIYSKGYVIVEIILIFKTFYKTVAFTIL